MRGKKLFLPSYVDSLQIQGRYTFTKQEALDTLQCQEINLSQSINRLIKKKRLQMPRKGFLVIIPLEYQLSGEVPIPWYIDNLMLYVNAPYYVGLLTAASIYEASPQTQEFHVLSPIRFRPLHTAHSTIHFINKTHFASSQVEDIKTPTGYMKVSSPGLTVFDLIKYPYTNGGLSNVVTVLKELGEKIKKKNLEKVLREENSPTISQRLGYLLEISGHKSLSEVVQQWLSLKKPKPTPLMVGKAFTHEQLNNKWILYINEELGRH